VKKSLLVIGGGIMGLSVAREMAGAGWKVEVLERGRLGGEASRASAGMIGPQSEAMENDAYFEATLESRNRWPEFASKLSADSGVDFGYRDAGAIHLAFGAAYEKRLEARYLWQKKAAGKVERLDREQTHKRWPWLHPRVSSVFYAAGDHWLDNEALMDALEAACRKASVTIHENTGADRLLLDGDAVVGAEAGGKTFRADNVLLAGGAWAGELLQGLPGDHAWPRFHPVKGQMIEFDLGDRFEVDLPIHAEFVYLVPRPDNRLAVGATVEEVGFDKTLTGEGIEWLLQGAFETIPDLRSCEVKRLWAGLRPGASDGWPTLGETGVPGLYMAAGHYRRGILFAPLTAAALCQSLLGETMPAAAKAFGFERHRAAASTT
jgi:glycine oxidase